jgi:hypothetical protein
MKILAQKLGIILGKDWVKPQPHLTHHNPHLVDPLGDDEKDEQQSDVLETASFIVLNFFCSVFCELFGIHRAVL